MSTSERQSPADDILAQFAQGLAERAKEVGLPHADAPYLASDVFKGGEASSSARLEANERPFSARGMMIGRYAVILGLLPETPDEDEVFGRLRRYRNQCVVARSYLAPNQALDLHLFLVGPRGSERSEAWRNLSLLVERDDKVARKIVWRRPAESDEIEEADRQSLDEFTRRTFLARPWQGNEIFSMAPLDNIGRGVTLNGVPRDTTGDWNQIAANFRSDPAKLVDELVDAWVKRGVA